MPTPLTREERLVLQLLVSGKRSEDIADALDLPPQVVRTCTHALITRVLEDLEPSTKRRRPLSH
jgi:DNA-binding NarL/FixJ family response regulator